MSRSVKQWFEDLHAVSKARRGAAERRFLGLTGADRALVPELADYLSSEDATYRYWAARGLSNINEHAQGAISALEVLLDDEDGDCRFWAVQALGNMGEVSACVMPALLKRLRDPEFGTRQAAALALVRVAPHRSETVEALEAQLAREEDEMVSEYLVRALGKLETPQAIQALISALEHRDLTVRTEAVIRLKCLGSAAASAHAALERLVERERDPIILLQAEVAQRAIRKEA